MDAISAENSSQRQMCKRNFFQWAIRWFYATDSKNLQEKPDVTLLATFFQSIGFRLQSVEKSDNVPNVDDGTRVENDNIRVTIECGNSGMKACLQLGNVECQCPDIKNTEDAPFRSGDSGPINTSTVMSSKNIETSGCNLLAPVSENTAKVINDVVYHLFKMIGEKNIPDVNQNTKSRSNLNLSRVGKSEDTEIHIDGTFRRESQNFGRSRTQPDIIINTNRPSICRGKLTKETTYNWGQTFDIEDTKSNHLPFSPSKIVRSSDFKLNQLCSSLESISLLNEQNTTNLAAHVLQAHKSIEKALEIICANKTPINEQTFLKPNVRGSTLSIVEDSSKKESSNNTNVSLKISPSRTFSRSIPSRKYTPVNLVKDNPTTEGSKLSINRRSTSTTQPAVGTHPNGAGCKNSQPNVVPSSKIPGNRKSFHSLGSTKLSAISGKNSDSLTHKDATPKDRFKASSIHQSTTLRMSSSLNQSSSIPMQKVKPLKLPGQRETKDTTRRSVGNQRFGYGNKKA